MLHEAFEYIVAAEPESVYSFEVQLSAFQVQFVFHVQESNNQS